MITYSEFEQQWLQDIQADNPNTVTLGHRFAQKILKDWYDLDESTAEVILADGAGDGGIDAAIFIKRDPDESIDGDSWLLIQSKYGTSYSGIETLRQESDKVFATLAGKKERYASFSKELIDRLKNFIANANQS